MKKTISFELNDDWILGELIDSSDCNNDNDNDNNEKKYCLIRTYFCHKLKKNKYGYFSKNKCDFKCQIVKRDNLSELEKLIKNENIQIELIYNDLCKLKLYFC